MTKTIEIIPTADPDANDPPVAVNDNVETTEGTPVVIDVVDNDLDPDGNETLGDPTVTTPPMNGMVMINPDGTITYTPDPGAEGLKISFAAPNRPLIV